MVHSFNLCKLCNIEDFHTAPLYQIIRMVFPHELKRFGSKFPIMHEYRKHWEVAMAIHTFNECGILHNDAEVLGVGAGNEPTIYHLTNIVRRVFATDLYLTNDDNEALAKSTMLLDPGRYWPNDWNEKHLIIQHMNALDLHYEDNTFDAIFSSSSIEHFGNSEVVKKAIKEMWRVLKPDGVLSLSTEYRLEGQSSGLPGILMFDKKEIETQIINVMPWSLINPLDINISKRTIKTQVPYSKADKIIRDHISKYGYIFYQYLDWKEYPVIVLREGSLLWTSIHLALRKKNLPINN